MIYAGLTPVIPIIFAFLTPLYSLLVKYRRIPIQIYALAGTFLTLITSFALLKLTYTVEKPIIYTFGKWKAPIGIIYEVDRTSALLAFITSLLLFLIAIYSYEYLKEERLNWYYTLYFGLEAGLLGVFLTGDAFNLFVMIEVMSISAYALVAFYRNREDAIKASLRYAFIGALGTTLYFVALGIFYGAFGTLNMADLSSKINAKDIATASAIALSLTIWAFLIKAAVFPNHFWLPDAHPAAPSPISAILSGLVVSAGIYAILRFLTTIYGGISNGESTKILEALGEILIVVGAISALLSAILMLVQNDIKRLIAYSTIMHMGYLAMAIGLRSSSGYYAGLFHLLNHAIAKSLLFLSAGIFIYVCGTRNIKELTGIGREMPLASASLTMGALALAGLPPFNVFYSKLALLEAFVEKSILLGLILAVSSGIAFVAYAKIFHIIWLKEKPNTPKVKEPIGMSYIALSIAIACLILGLLTPIPQELVRSAIAQTLTPGLYTLH